MSWAGQVLLDHTAHREQRLRAGLSASGPRLGHGLTAQDTQSPALMRRWWALMTVHPAPHHSFLHWQSPEFALQPQAQVWWVSPAQG